MNFIEINDLVKIIHGKEVLSHINLSLEKNKIYGVVGNNGSGKTMLFRAISGFIKPTSGTITINGKQIGKDCSFPESTGVIIENVGLWGGYTGAQDLKILAKISKKKISIIDIKNVLEKVGLAYNDKRLVKMYSLGMKQRLAIAQAIMENPNLLILDEPTNGLDSDGMELIRQLLINERNNGKTILLASHNKDDINMLCNETYIMNNGKLLKSKEENENA